jgi:drug/metabolite transporter (DMT)-like permease
MKGAGERPSAGVVGGLVLAIVLDTVIQLSWKRASAGAGGEALASLAAAARTPWFALAMAGFACQLVNWVRVLSRADLSYAQPITALSYITVLAGSSLLLGEPVSARQVAGIGVILVGTALVASTPSKARP